MEKVEVYKRMKVDDAIQMIKEDLNSIIPETEGKAISLQIAKHVFNVFFNSVSYPVSALEYDKEILYTFSFFLSKDSEFIFTQSYLQGKMEAFLNNIKQARECFRIMITHFNLMIKYMGQDLKPYRLVYNELFSFKFDKDKGKWKPMLLYGKLGGIMTIKNSVFQVYKDTTKNPNVLIYTSRYTEKSKEDRDNLATLL